VIVLSFSVVVNRFRAAVLLTLGAAIVLGLDLACGDSLEVTPNDAPPDGGVGSSNPDAAVDDPSTADAETFEPDPPDEPLPPLLDAGCQDASFTETFDPPISGLVTVATVGGQAIYAGGFFKATANNVDKAQGYVRRALCDPPPTATCVVRVKVDELIKGQIALLELEGQDQLGKRFIIRVKTNEVQITEQTDRANQLMPALSNEFVNLTITAKNSGIRVDPGGVTFDAGIGGMKFKEIRTGVIYLARSDFDAARAAVTVDSVSCTFTP
jgi:hypothetical protein